MRLILPKPEWPGGKNRRQEHVKKSERRPRRPEFLRVHCGGYGAMPSGLVFRGNTGTGTCEKIESGCKARCTICNAGTDEIFPRRSCAEIFRLSPYCLARAIRTAVFRRKHQPAIRGQIKEFGQTPSPLRFFHIFPGPMFPFFAKLVSWRV